MKPAFIPFEKAFLDVTGGNNKLQTTQYSPTGLYPVIDQGESFIGGYTNDPKSLCAAIPPVILFGDHTKVFKYVDFPFCLGADGVKVLRPAEGIFPKYGFYFLRSLILPSVGYSRHFKFLKEFEVPLPPLSEQRRIAAILDSADAIRTKRKAAIAKLDELAQALFLEMFGDPVRNEKGWAQSTLGEIGTITTGNTPARSEAGNFGSHLEWIKSDNVTNEYPTLTKATEFLSKKGASIARLVGPGAVLVVCIAGSPDSIGRAALADRTVAFNQQINAISPREDMDEYFLLQAIRYSKKCILSYSTNSMKGMISKSVFEGIPLIVPPIRLQEMYSERYTSILSVKKSHSATSESENRLFSSLQHRAFAGEL